MAWETHLAKSAFAKFSDDWDRLNSQLYKSHPFFDSRFVGPLLEYFADGKEQLCIYRTDGIVSGALILQAKGSGRWSLFRPPQIQASAVLLGDSRLLESLFKALPDFAWTIELHAIDPRYSPDFLSQSRHQVAHFHARTIGIHPDISFSEYWAQRSNKLKANIRRYSLRSENEFGTPILSKSSGPAQMNAGVKRFGELESAGWKGKAGTAVSMDNRQGEFYSAVLGRFALSNQAAIYELHIADQLAASRLVISNDQMLVLLKTTYDESLARVAPGRILLYRMIQEQLDSPSNRTIEFYTNATHDQKEWASFDCFIQSIQLFRNDLFFVVFAVLKAIRRNPCATDEQSTAATDGHYPMLDVKSFTSVHAVATEDYDLRDYAAKDNVEASIDWFDLIQKNVYPTDPGVRYYVASENGFPLIVLPLRLTTKWKIKTVESLGNYYTSLYTPLLSKDSNTLALKPMLAAASLDHGGAHVMRFSPMDPDSPAYKGLINELRAIGWVPFRFFCFGNWLLKVEDNWEGYLKKRSANLRSTISRMNKKFAAEGGTMELVTTSEGVEQAIEAFYEVYSASWKTQEPYPDFVPSFIRLLASTGKLRLGIARLKEKPIAAQLWIVAQDKASIYKVAYHEEYSRFSPGTILTSYLMRHVIENDQVNEVDFLIGDDKYKQIWMSDRRERWGIIAYNPGTIVGFALLMKESIGRLLKMLITRLMLFSPAFKTIVKKVRSAANQP
jgi:CelD/BcsL family acetyltransferase involved in cellulose biosynthesis